MGNPNLQSNPGVTPAALDQSPRFLWHTASCAPRERPMHLLQGAFIDATGAARQILRTSLLHNGWGEVGSVSLAVAGPSPLPVALSVTWLCFAGNRFYKGRFPLPAARLSELFQSGYIHPATGQKSTWDTLLAGLAPGGRLVLWVAGGGLTVEVCSFQAPEASIEWSATPLADAGPRDEYIRESLASVLSESELAQLAATGPTPERWDLYRTRWPWRPLLLGASTSQEPAAKPTLRIRAFNGECEFLTDFAAGIRPRATPRALELRYTGADGLRRVADIQCDEKETFAAFAKLSQRKGASESLALHLDTAGAAGGVRIYLCDDSYSLELLAAQVKVYRNSQ